MADRETFGGQEKRPPRIVEISSGHLEAAGRGSGKGFKRQVRVSGGAGSGGAILAALDVEVAALVGHALAGRPRPSR